MRLILLSLNQESESGPELSCWLPQFVYGSHPRNRKILSKCKVYFYCFPPSSFNCLFSLFCFSDIASLVLIVLALLASLAMIGLSSSVIHDIRNRFGTFDESQNRVKDPFLDFCTYHHLDLLFDKY